MPQKELCGLLNRIGNFDAKKFETDFNERLITQKTVYLLQAFGLNLGYHYNWYLRGPYSTDLTRDTYALAKDYNNSISASFVKPIDESRFGEFLRFLGDKKCDQYWMEVAASTHFLAKLHGETNEEYVYAQVKAKMGHLDRATFVSIWNDLCRNGLLNNTIKE